MPAITIYLPADLEKAVRRSAKQAHKSVSRWIADQVRRDLSDAWPSSVLDAAGAFPDFPDLQQLRKGYGRDVRRERVE